jgi:tRNA A37 threonylcarbamoyladenosine dehydratase
MPILVDHANVPDPREAEAVEDDYKLHRRFDRMGRLVGDEGMRKLLSSSAMVVGLGGVGSFAAEALVRSGVGRLVLVDFDKVCITNTNRQLQAMKGTVGKHKADVLRERLQLVNPQAELVAHRTFYNPKTSAALLDVAPDVVVDAIDNVSAKCHLLASCRERGLRVVTSMGASGRMDPTRVAVKDLAHTTTCGLASEVRRILRKDHGFPDSPRGASGRSRSAPGLSRAAPDASPPFGIPAVFSTEPPAPPHELTYDGGLGFRCVCPGGKNGQHDCEERRVIYGTAAFVTGTFGLTCASVAVRMLLEP